MAQRLAGDDGIICETDEYFHTQVGVDPRRYDYDAELLPTARQWNLDRFRRAIDEEKSPIVVDRGNGRNAESREYAAYAVEHGYHIELKEPDSSWWQEIRVLLKYKQITWPILEKWAEQLAEITRKTHRVPSKTILSWMKSWKYDLTVEDILNE